MRYFPRFLLLTAAFALTVAGLMAWHDVDFGLDGIWPLEGALRLHPLHLLTVGLAIIPRALWEVFLLERPLERPALEHRGPERNGPGPQVEDA